MKTIENKNKAIIGFLISEAEFRNFEANYVGLCFGCGSERSMCEPDARAYECEVCEEKKVFGVPEILMMGRLRFTGEN